MKKVLAAILAFSLLFCTAAAAFADTEPEEPTERTVPLTLYQGFDTLYKEMDNGLTVYVTVPGLFVPLMERDTFPELQKAFDEFNTELAQDAKEMFALLEEYATDDFAASGEAQDLWSASNVEYHRAGDASVVSALVFSKIQTGGVHPYTDIVTRTFDCMTGEVVPLNEVIKDTDLLAKYLADTLQAEHAADAFLSEDVEADVKAMIDSGSLCWTVDYQGMTFYFPAETLACYAEGNMSVFIPYGINMDIFRDVDFIGTTASEYMVGMSPDNTLCYMLKDDGPVNRITVSFDNSENPGDEDYTDTAIFCVDDVMTQCETGPSFETSMMSLVRVGLKNYIYLVTRGDNDYNMFSVYEILEDGTVAEKGTISSSAPSSDGRLGDYVIYPSAFDPMELGIDTMLDILSTAAGNRLYYAGDDGVPVPYEEDYIMDPFTLTLLQKIDGVTEVDEDGNEVKSKVDLKEGDALTVIRINTEKKYVDAETTDGRYVRLPYAEDGDGMYPLTVNGTNIEELFDGMFYAG